MHGTYTLGSPVRTYVFVSAKNDLEVLLIVTRMQVVVSCRILVAVAMEVMEQGWWKSWRSGSPKRRSLRVDSGSSSAKW